MGKAIEKIAHEMGHEIVGKFGRSAPPSISALKPADVAIEFTQPELAPKHIALCKAAGIPVVVGTTGWYAHFEDIKQQFHSEGALFTATNFSIGVNITFYINRVLAGIMNRYPEYAAGITEIHHTQKIDAPSGTAISLAEGIIKENLSFDNWELSNEEKQAFGGKIPIHAVRENDVPGTHTISWNSAIDNISITHLAHNRQGFAKGAVLAAEWIIGKQGVYSMEDMLNFESI
ncbi:MAG: 4-hydroxy-tetrahydrodipicolinate reductase [Bacteroidota bacterium]